MTRRRTLLAVALAVPTTVVVGALVALSYDAPCGEEAPWPDGGATMQAVTYRCYGASQVLEL
jgi:hypothetical protein